MVAATLAPAAASAGSEIGGEDEGWVPSLAIHSGVTLQNHSGSHRSFVLEEGAAMREPLREPEEGDDRVVSAYVGGALELLSPALPVPGRPRLFVNGEILPAFGSERTMAEEGNPSRIRGSDFGSIPAVDERPDFYTTNPAIPQGQGRTAEFGEDEANGQGMRTTAQLAPLVFGARIGAAFPFRLMGRELRLRPSVGWIRFEVDGEGLLVDPTCDPSTQCTNTYNSSSGEQTGTGFVRESIVTGSKSGTFDGFGPGIELEMDTGRIGPLGSALFAGLHGYYIPGDREIEFSASRTFDDQIGMDRHDAEWRVRVNPWIYRIGLGFRLQWLGSAK